MTSLVPPDPAETEPEHVLPPGAFGAGRDEPYARALADAVGLLSLHEWDPESGDGGAPGRHVETFDTAVFAEPATSLERRLLRGLDGPLIDLGCGPGRMVRAALRQGISAIGVDVSAAAVDLAVRSGLAVLRRSVFEPLPLEGRWRSALLLDGNIGIGGDPTALLARCGRLLAPGGALVAEVHSSAARDHEFEGTLTDERGRTSERFPWAQLGAEALAARARGTVLALDQSWSIEGRTFCRLTRR